MRMGQYSMMLQLSPLRGSCPPSMPLWPSKESIKELSKAYKIEKRNLEKTVPDPSEDEGKEHGNSNDSRYVKFSKKTTKCP